MACYFVYDGLASTNAQCNAGMVLTHSWLKAQIFTLGIKVRCM